MDKRPIGFMDSGVGGLTAVKEALQQLPNESMVFLAIKPECHTGQGRRRKFSAFHFKLRTF